MKSSPTLAYHSPLIMSTASAAPPIANTDSNQHTNHTHTDTQQSSSSSASTPTAASASASTYALLAVTPLDGRYESQTHPLKKYVSEYGLFYARIYIEIQWLILMIQTPEFSREIGNKKISTSRLIELLNSIVENFSVEEAL